MTLTISAANRNLVVQSGDFRLTDVRTGNVRDFDTQKQFTIDQTNWTALVAFSGIGHTGRLDVASWIAAEGHFGSQEISLPQYLKRLESFADEISQLPLNLQRHTFVLSGFSGIQPFVSVVSNFESLTSEPRASALGRLSTTTVRPGRTRVFVKGSGSSFATGQDRERVAHALNLSDPADAMRVVAEVNAEIAARGAGVSPACYVSWRRADGRGGSTAFGLPDDQAFTPRETDALFQKLGIRLNPAKNPDGSCKPIRVIGSAISSHQASHEFHAKNIELNPDDPNAWNNLGAFLSSKGENVAAEKAFARALELGPTHPTAAGNLAGVRLQQEREGEALQLLEIACAVDRPEVNRLLTYASLLTRRFEWMKSKEALGRALELSDDEELATRILGDLDTLQQAIDASEDI